MIRYQDIQISDKKIKDEYCRLISEDKIDEAKDYLETNIDQIKEKTLNNIAYNELIQEIIRIERFYFDYKDGIDYKVEQFENDISNIKDCGDYNSEEIYYENNFVHNNDEVYFCIKDATVGITLDNQEYWIKLDLKGRNGDVIKLGIKNKGSWNTSVTYSKNDLVIYDNMIYVSKTNNNIGNNPKTSTTNWLSGTDSNYQNIWIGDEEPTNAIIGDLWLERM